MKKLKRINAVWHFMRRHKYTLTLVLFGVVIGFLDENSLWTRFQHRREIATLRDEIQRYDHMIKTDNERLQALDKNPDYLEKIARERYFMKKADEDVFVFESDQDEAAQ